MVDNKGKIGFAVKMASIVVHVVHIRTGNVRYAIDWETSNDDKNEQRHLFDHAFDNLGNMHSRQDLDITL